MSLVGIKQGESKSLILIVRDADGSATDLSSTTLFLGIKRSKSDSAYVIQKDNSDFVRTQEATGIVTVLLTEEDTAASGQFIGELKVQFEGGNIEKSSDFKLTIEKAVTS